MITNYAATVYTDAQLIAYTGYTWTDPVAYTSQKSKRADAKYFFSETTSMLMKLRDIAITNGMGIRVRNVSGGTLAAGPVRVTGYNSANDRFTITLADADANAPADLLLLSSLANNTDGMAYFAGEFVSALDTSAISIGTEVFLSATGTITTTAPTGGDQIVQSLGFTKNQSATGTIKGFVHQPKKFGASWLQAAMSMSWTGDHSFGGAIVWNGIISPTALAANTNDWAPTGFATANTIRISASSAVDLTGIAGGSSGRILTIHNVGANAITLKDESASSTAGNRFALSADLTLGADSMIMLQYDATSSRWRCISGASMDINGLTAADVALNDTLPIYDVSATANRKTTVERLQGWFNSTCNGRLTLTSQTPVTTSDVSNATTIYYCPYAGRKIALNDGTRWVLREFTEIAIPLGTLTSGKNYDVFAFTSTAAPSSTDTGTDVLTFGSATGWSTGAQVVPDATGGGLTAGTTYFYNAASATTGSLHTTLSDALSGASKVNLTASITANLTAVTLAFSAAWTSDTARSDALVLTDWVLTKTGTSTHRYLGTFRTTSTTQTQDKLTQRFLWNYYNRVSRPMMGRRVETGGATSSTSVGTSFTSLGADFEIECVQGYAEDEIALTAFAVTAHGTAGTGNAVAIAKTTQANAMAKSLATTPVNNYLTSHGITYTDPAVTGYEKYLLSAAFDATTGTVYLDFGGGHGESATNDPPGSLIRGILRG